MKRILVPTDFSPEADSALEVARDLAKKFGAEIHFVHIIEPLSGADTTKGLVGYVNPSGDSINDLFMLKYMERCRDDLKKRALSSRYIDITTHMDIIVDDIFAGIKKFVEEKEIDLIVMGSKGASGLDEILVGSNSEKVIRYSPCPVLVVKGKVEEFLPKSILFPTDCIEPSAGLAELLNDMATNFEAKLHLLHVNTPSNFYSTRSSNQMLLDYAQQTGLKDVAVHSYNDISEEDGILSFAEDNGVDMIVMSTRGRTGVSRLIAGSIASDVVNHSKLPVLVYRIKK